MKQPVIHIQPVELWTYYDENRLRLCDELVEIASNEDTKTSVYVTDEENYPYLYVYRDDKKIFESKCWSQYVAERNLREIYASYLAPLKKDFAETILPLLPDDLVEAIIPRRIVQRMGGSEFESVDKIWAPSYTELFGTDRGTDQTGDVGDVQFEFFKSKKNRIKFFKDDVNYWWLRSPSATNSTAFWNVYSYGNMSNYGANYSIGVCPCFIISQP